VDVVALAIAIGAEQHLAAGGAVMLQVPPHLCNSPVQACAPLHGCQQLLKAIDAAWVGTSPPTPPPSPSRGSDAEAWVPHYRIPTISMQHLHSSGAAIPFGINGFRFAAKRVRLWGDLALLRSDATCELAGFADLMTR